MGKKLVVTPRHVYAAGVLRKHLAALSARTEGVEAGQAIEAVHKMRVATRRLRTALGLFEDIFPAKRFARWFKQVKGMTRVLGRARDLDVQIDSVGRFSRELAAAHDPIHQEGIDRLILRLKQKRSNYQPRLVAALAELHQSGVVDEMNERLEGIRVRGRLLQVGGEDEYLRNEASQVIRHRLAEMMAWAQYIRDPQRVEELHAMRRLVKILRYSLETYAKLFPSRLKWQVDLLKNTQTHLGDIHDCDLWIQYLPWFIEAERARHEKFFGHRRGFSRVEDGVDFLLQVRQHQRQNLYQQFVATWEAQARERRWEQLAGSLVQESAKMASAPPVATDHGIAGRIGGGSSRA